MKRISIIAIAAIAALALTGCATTGETGAAATAKSAADATPAINNPAPTGTVDMLDGIEEGLYWAAVGDSWNNDDGSNDVEESTDWASEGSTSLLLDFSAGDPNSTNAGDKATFFCDALAIQDFTEYKQIVLDVNNPTEGPIDFVVVLQAGDDWKWCQSAAQTIGAGENKNVTYDIAALGVPDTHIGVIHRMCFCLFQEVDGPIYVDNIRLVK